MRVKMNVTKQLVLFIVVWQVALVTPLQAETTASTDALKAQFLKVKNCPELARLIYIRAIELENNQLKLKNIYPLLDDKTPLALDDERASIMVRDCAYTMIRYVMKVKVLSKPDKLRVPLKIT